MKWFDASGDIAAASTALGGLLLVFIGAIAAGYASYDAEAQDVVRGRFRTRAWAGFTGFFLALLAAGSALVGKVLECDVWVEWAAGFVAASFIVAILAAGLSVLEIR